MTTLPDWLVERAALDEVPAASAGRLAAADPAEVAREIDLVRAANAAELAAYPAEPALAQIDARAKQARARHRASRTRWLGSAGLALAAAAGLAIYVGTRAPSISRLRPEGVAPVGDTERVKGTTRLVVYRQVGEHAERLAPDTLAHAGDVLQLRYDAGGERFGIIASVDGAGVVTLHYPAAETAAPEATALAARLTTLPQAYALDDAPRFERFFFLTSGAPIDLGGSLATLRTFAQRPDAADATPELPSSIHQWSLRVRKP